MKNPVALSSPFVSQFGFTAVLDFHLKKITLDVADLTIFKVNGVNHVTAIQFTVTDPTGVSYPVQDIDIKTYSAIVIPMVALYFGAYTFKAELKDDTGAVSIIKVSKNVCEPENWDKTAVQGCFDITADCRIPTIKVSDNTSYSYMEREPSSQVKTGKLFYPENAAAELEFGSTPFTIGEKEGIYLGDYKTEALTVSTYNIGDSISVVLPTKAIQEFAVDCNRNIGAILKCVSDLYNKYILSRGSVKAAQIKELLDGISFDLTVAILKGQLGYDNSEELLRLQEVLECDCGCNSLTYLEPGLLLAGNSFSIVGDEGVTVTRETLGNTDRFTISVDYDSISEGINLDGLLSLLRASIEINSRQIALKVSQTDFDALGNRVALAETAIIQTAFSISLKANQSLVDQLSGRLTQAEASIVIHSSAITSKVSYSEFNALGLRVGAAESSIVQQAGQIALKVSQSDFNALGVRVGLAESSITQQGNQIALKVSKTDFDALGVRVGLNESSIIQQGQQIALKVSKTEYDAFTGQANTRFSLIEQTASSINLYVQGLPTREYVDSKVASGGNGDVLNTYNTRITQLESSIALTATKVTTDLLGQKLATAEASIVINAEAITSKVSQTTFNELGGRVGTVETKVIQTQDAITSLASKSSVEALSGRVTTAESQISQNASAIELKVSQATFDSLGSKVGLLESNLIVQAGLISSKVSSSDLNGARIISEINQSPESIKINAKNIDLIGITTAKYFRTAESGRRITINENDDNALKIWYENNVVGLEGVVTSDNQVKLIFRNPQNEIIWEAGKSGFVYFREVLESWSPRFHRLVGVLVENMEEFYDLNGNLMFSGEQLRGMAASTTNTNGLAVRGERVQISDGQIYEYRDYQLNTSQFVTDYDYNAGQNLNSSVNAQYNGIHLDAEKSSPFIATGWYLTNGSAYGWSPLGGYSFQYEVVAIFQGKVIGSVTGQVDNIALPNN